MQYAVKRGSTVVGVRGQSSVILAAEMKQAQDLQDMRTVRKILKVDDHVALAFAGLQADARVLINKARMQCQSSFNSGRYQKSMGCTYNCRDATKIHSPWWTPPIWHLNVIAGHDMDGKPQLWQTDPSGNYSSWTATVCGRNSKSVRELLEEEYDPGMTEEDSLRVACRALLETAERGSKGLK